ncbi:TPA: hypothetical protein HA225_02950 [Candidatus Micrarchaeota archaeon]|nr:hypothetical protein [Candidatus Micrarchaeota archaeon]
MAVMILKNSSLDFGTNLSLLKQKSKGTIFISPKQLEKANELSIKYQLFLARLEKGGQFKNFFHRIRHPFFSKLEEQRILEYPTLKHDLDSSSKVLELKKKNEQLRETVLSSMSNHQVPRLENHVTLKEFTQSLSSLLRSDELPIALTLIQKYDSNDVLRVNEGEFRKFFLSLLSEIGKQWPKDPVLRIVPDYGLHGTEGRIRFEIQYKSDLSPEATLKNFSKFDSSEKFRSDFSVQADGLDKIVSVAIPVAYPVPQ